MTKETIQVTQPFLPPREEYNKYVDEIYDRNWLTNNGPLAQELEYKLAEYLKTDGQLSFVSNGTIALQIAIKALKLRGDIITTPFSYVATTSSIVWEGCNPVFVDIDPESLNINADKIEEALTPSTSAILATHVYGIPCDVEKIQKIAHKHKLKVIYDAAHGFGTKINDKSIFDFGDISTCSFHATKLFHTIEGGAVFTKDPNLHKRIQYKRNFGHDGPLEFYGVGINGKNSEFHAAMGLSVLPYMDEILKRRQQQCLYYDERLNTKEITRPHWSPDVTYNFAYYPLIMNSENTLIKVKEALEQENIFTRRYFYPLLSTLNYVEGDPLAVAESVSKRILCLPLFHTLSKKSQDRICTILTDNLI